MDKLDNFDCKILSCLQENSRQTAERISAQVGLSPAACQRRIRKLREEGAIAKEVAILNPAVVGGRTTLLVQICFAIAGVDIIERFKQQICELPEVQQGYHCIGEVDFILVMTVKDMQDYDRIMREYFMGNTAIRRFEAIVTINTIKEGFYIPIEAG